ncbi:MAG: hypothetical protein GWM98_04640 [Nitrospinaceae bacterium]|nr:hypothetical protein [Deltaproteobacteria bacterium]NIY14207.1 hypothetical protein [Nitrospinaceae bacterium]
MSFGDYLENEVLDHVFGADSYSPPASLYVGLSSTDPGDDGSGITEPSGGAYARVEVTNNTTNWPAAVSGAKANGTLISFPKATALWGTMAWVIIMDAASGGNFLAGGALTASKIVDVNDQPSFSAGDIVVTLD